MSNKKDIFSAANLAKLWEESEAVADSWENENFTINIELSQEVFSALEEIAEEFNISISDLVSKILASKFVNDYVNAKSKINE